MGRRGHGEQQIATILKKSEAGMSIPEICREYGISERTFYRWKANRSGPGSTETRTLRQIEEENQRLNSVVAELILENRALRDDLARSRRSADARRAAENGNQKTR